MQLAELERSRFACNPDMGFQYLIRRRARSRPTTVGDACVNSELTAARADSPAEFRAAAALVAARYGDRGYLVERVDDHLQAGVTLIVPAYGTIVGTLTLRFDGPQGLCADENYRETLDAQRRDGRGVCEVTRLALEPGVDSCCVLSALFGLTFVISRYLHGASDLFAEVNPRHAVFYRKILGFVVAAGRSICPRVMAPAVLMRLELERLEQQLADLGALDFSLLAPSRPQLAAA